MSLNEEGLLRLKRALWPENNGDHVWALLDGAQDDRIAPAAAASLYASACLFAGKLTPELQSAAPYLVLLHPNDPFTDRLLTVAWGHAWGIFIRSHVSTEMLRKHLKTLLRVRSPEGRMMLFRFYDPRVLNRYLPTCTPSELHTVWGPHVQALLAESADGLLLRSHVRAAEALVTTESTVVPGALPA